MENLKNLSFFERFGFKFWGLSKNVTDSTDPDPNYYISGLPAETDVRNWTSLDLAKPVWEEEPRPDSFEEGFVEQVIIYG